MNADLPPQDKLLFTPGPLTTSATVKGAMLRDFGSRDKEFIALVQEVRDELLALGGVSTEKYTAILMQKVAARLALRLCWPRPCRRAEKCWSQLTAPMGVDSFNWERPWEF